MKSPVLRPRPDQIAELTRGVQLPLAPLAEFLMTTLAEKIATAYADLQLRHEMTSRDEQDVNALLETRLNSLIVEDLLWQQLVRSVARGKESISFDGKHLEKRPDLSFCLTQRDSRFPLVAECKIIDGAAHRDEVRYYREGIWRFVAGDYAWASQEAFMIAYVRDGSSTGERLTPYLTQLAAHGQPNHAVVEGLAVRSGQSSLDLVRSRHGRSFAYLNHESAEPGPISIWHLWLA